MNRCAMIRCERQLGLLTVFLSIGLTWPTAVSAQHADLLIRDANVLCCDAEMNRATAVAITAGRIVAVGSDDDLGDWIDPDRTTVIDAKGQAITPGLIDSHLHLLGLGQSLQMLDLSTAATWSEIVGQVEDAAKLVPEGTWIEGRGWHQSKWKRPPQKQVEGYPDHQSLSRAVPNHPVILTHASGHAVIANQAAMKLAGVDRETSDPAGGEIVKDSDGRPIGLFRENAGGLIRRAQSRTIDRQTQQQRLQQFRERVRMAGDECLRHGVTSVHDAGSSFATASRLRQLAEKGELPIRMAVMIREGSRSLAAKMPTHRWLDVGDGLLTVRSVKVSIDGALGPHGAWLLEPYTDLPSSRGLNTVAIDELERIARLCKQHDWQLCVHAIGDRANREVLDVYEEVLGEKITADHRWRIEHAQHLHPLDIPRFGKLGVIPAMQAIHCTSDAIFVPTRLGQRRSAQGAYVWRSLIDTGAIIANGSDAPVERVDPLASLDAAVTRKLPDGVAFYPEQCMTRGEALLSYTLWPARAAFQEHDLGSIEVGKRADLVMWDTDLLNCPPEAIRGAKAKRVWLGGVEVTVK